MLLLLLDACSVAKKSITEVLSKPATVKNLEPLVIDYELEGNKIKKVSIDLHNLDNYGSLSLYADSQLLVDNLNVPKSGKQVLNTLVQFEERFYMLRVTFTSSDGNMYDDGVYPLNIVGKD